MLCPITPNFWLIVFQNIEKNLKKGFTCHLKHYQRRNVSVLLHGEENGNLYPYSCLENPVDRGAWWAMVHGVAKELEMTW